MAIIGRFCWLLSDLVAFHRFRLARGGIWRRSFHGIRPFESFIRPFEERILPNSAFILQFA